MVRAKRRQQVLDSAKEVFSRKGFHKASIADIVQKAGIARATFYLYFKNKRNLFHSLLEFLLQELDRRVETIKLSEGHPPPLEQLRVNLTRVITFSMEEPQLIQILFHSAVGMDREFERELDRFYERVVDRIEGALRLGIDMGLVRPGSARLIAYTVLGGIKEIMVQVASRRISSLNAKVVVDDLLEFGRRGVLLESVE
ncbi:MAG: TetR/AcrR family transcriptional regulator [Candidatus Methylomirabilota bacterium]